MTFLPAGTRQAMHGRGSRWLTKRAIIAHITLAIWIPGCAVAAWWQVGIALGGNGLGWVYSVMWPCFGLFGTIFWWFLIHDDPETLGARGVRQQRALQALAAEAPSRGPVAGSPVAEQPDDMTTRLAQAEADDPELAAYNAYLASLADRDNG